jgi:hypothetical protein
VTTLNENEFVRVDWSEPSDNGSPITAYEVFILQSDGSTYTKENVDCVPIVASRTCLIKLTTLKEAPYNLVKGDSVYAQVTSTNAYGTSVNSPAGNTAVIRDVPDAPTLLQNVAFSYSSADTTTDEQIRFTWQNGATDGGAPVIDYDVYYD